MAVLSNIREKSPKFIIAGAAVIFIFLIIFDWGLDITNRRGRGGKGPEVLGTVNGKEIDHRMFNEMVRRAVENQKKQQNAEIDDETEHMIRSQVWNQMVDELLIEQEIERLGITVSDQEILDIVNGPNPPEFLVQQFKDSTGTFRRDAYLSAMRDPQNKKAWIEVENMIRQSQKRQKLQSLLLATTMVSESEVKQRFIDRTVTMNANFVLFDVNRFVPDSEVTVTDDDIQNQYESHAADFQVKAQRKIKFVFFNQEASSEDSTAVEKDALSILEQANSGAMDFADLAKIHSDIPITDVFFKRGELSKQKEDAIFSAKKGDIVGPIKDNDGIHLIKIIDQRLGAKAIGKDRREFKIVDLALKVKASPQTTETVSQNAQDFGFLAKEEGFEKAAENSKYQVRETFEFPKGGSIPGIGSNDAVMNFAFTNKVGAISDPISFRNGLIVVKVSNIREDGIRPLEEVKASVKPMAVKQKKMEKIREQVDAFYKTLTPSSDILAAAQSNLLLIAQNTGMFKPTEFPQGVGRDQKFIGTALALKQGELSKPVEGTRGYYIIQMISKTPVDSSRYDIERESLSAQLLQEKRNRALSEWHVGLREKAEIIDHRNLFFR
jgi:peptidyl-prolyl cis-trans isomerase D